MTRVSGALVFFMIGCVQEPAPEPLEQAPLAEVCGEVGPVRLLALEPNERMGYGSFTVVGDRLLFVAGTVEQINPLGLPVRGKTTAYAVGPCGEDPVVVASDVSVFSEPSFPGVVFGCTAAQDLVRLDPSGVASPRLLARGACHPSFTEYGLLSYVDAGGGWDHTVDYYPLLDAERPTFGAPIRVAEPVKIINSVGNSVRILRDEVLMVEDGELARYGLPDLERTVLANDVVVFAVSEDGRYLFYQGPGHEGDEGDQYNPIGPIYASDRESGVSGPIGTGALTLADFFADDFISLNMVDHQRLVSLPEYEFFEVPAGHDVQARLADGRWLTSLGDCGPYYRFDAEDGSVALLTEHEGRIRGSVDEHLDLMLSCGGYRPREMGAWVRHYYDGRAPQTLAERVNLSAVMRDDGRILTMVDVDEDALGVLAVVDPATAEGLRIDDEVSVVLDLEPWSHPTEEGAVIYGVDDGERSGVWVARPE